MIILLIAALMGATTTLADLAWGYTGNLAGYDSGSGVAAAGWFVQMYQDVNSDSVLGSISAFDNVGTAIDASGTGNISDDVLLASFTGTVIDAGKAGLMWGEAFPSWSSMYGEDAYTVLFNAGSIGTATRAVVVDASPFTLPGSDPADYTIGSINNSSVTVVPEPATLGLFGLGALSAWIIRRNKKQVREEEV